MTQRVLILCTGNSARSQMAEGLLRDLAGDRFEVFSAGTRPSLVNPLAIAVMAERGLDLSRHRSKHMNEFLSQPFDFVITVCDDAAEACPVFPGRAQRIHWSFADPAAAEGDHARRLEVFRETRDAIEARLRSWLAAVELTVELHSHTYVSDDCLMRPADIVRTCARRGIHRLAVTDHNTIAGALETQALAPELVIVGEEVMTTQGELLGYFLREPVPAGLTPVETIQRLRAQGAAISVSHPFDRLRHGAWQQPDLAAILTLVDAIEVFNSRCIYPEDNARALAFAVEHGKLGTVGSDAHSYRELGRAVLKMPLAGTPVDLIAGFSAGERVTHLSSPAIHFTSRWAKLLKRLAPRARQPGSQTRP